MKDKTPPMAHQLSSAESHHQLKKPHHPKGQNMGQEHKHNSVKDGSQYLDGLVCDSDSQYLEGLVSSSQYYKGLVSGSQYLEGLVFGSQYYKRLVFDFRPGDISSSPKKYSNKDNNTLGQTPLAAKVHEEEVALDDVKEGTSVEGEDSGRERLKRHRVEVAGRVWIPDIWGQEELLKDWIDCAAFDAPLVPSRIVRARAALVEEGRRPTSSGLRIENRC